MPVRGQKRTPVDRFANTADPRTAVYSISLRPPEYKENSVRPEPQSKDPAGYVSPTTDRDLEYFQAIAVGDKAPDNQAPPTLVLNLFRATQTQVLPIAERITLGAAAGAPYYALHATPSSTSATEFNTLLITRRHPIRATYSDACAVEILPKLDLLVQGVKTIARIVRERENKREEYYLTWGGFGDCYSLWRRIKADGNNGDEGTLAHLFCERWDAHDDHRFQGIIRAKQPLSSNPEVDPRSIPADIATLDATKPWPQFVSRNHYAHEHMDVLVASFLTVVTVQARRERELRELGSLPGYTP
ncbi:hypothetical protein GP486_001879 [Trichoglossum hirsutum]|uniref:Uncharacterized protein n=1 Tax=Trichoglossum hirsutum TaxID=265104 RepID=A0A9P8LG55_9PEZI|nr:hypothetical protein GP486_001879 [Trichoglossum hirsutum]